MLALPDISQASHNHILASSILTTILLQAHLSEFHCKHFSSEARDYFSTHFLGPAEGAGDLEGLSEALDGDELGYYPDGVKRTLTDEQVAIFRHSEIEALLRAQRYAQESKDSRETSANSLLTGILVIEDGELENDKSATCINEKSNLGSGHPDQKARKKACMMNTKHRKAQYAKERGFFKQKIKPDLRKRTWDKVEAGMDSLMYDEDGSGSTMTEVDSQRRRISYDDD